MVEMVVMIEVREKWLVGVVVVVVSLVWSFGWGEGREGRGGGWLWGMLLWNLRFRRCVVNTLRLLATTGSF